MNIKQKKNILAHLARKAEQDSTVMVALVKEISKIDLALKNEAIFERIEEQLDLLDAIAYRLHEQSVVIIKDLLNRLNTIEVIYENELGYSSKFVESHKGKSRLTVRALEVLEHIRYHRPEEILSIMFSFSADEHTDIAKQAIQGIEAFSEYDLDIFYGDGEKWHGLGWQPQEKIIDFISNFSDDEYKNYFNGIIAVAKKVLSPTIEGRQWSMNSVVLRTGVVPVEVNIIRKKTLTILRQLLLLSNDFSQEKAVVQTLNCATQTPHMGSYSDAVLEMIVSDTVDVLTTMLEIISGVASLQIMQEIEHDAYWLFYHKRQLDPRIGQIALQIRDFLYAHAEFSIFRVLIGYGSIFHPWEDSREHLDYDTKLRDSECERLATQIDENSYLEWKHRIVHYANLKSKDMATFPSFGYFLECFGKANPVLAMKFLAEASSEIEGFIVAVLHGICQTEHKQSAYELISSWCEDGKHIFSIAKFIEFRGDFATPVLLQNIIDKARQTNDLHTLNQIVISTSAQYSSERKFLLNDFFIPLLKHLTSFMSADWVHEFWFKKHIPNMIGDMSADYHQCILNNLLVLREINYHSEEILYLIAAHNPALVLQFFCDRMTIERSQNSHYESVPYDFHKLSEPLSTIPNEAVDIVFSEYDGNYGMLIYRGAKLLKNIFPNLSGEFEKALIRIIHSESEHRFLFVLAILRNYDGAPIIHNVCKELIVRLPSDSDLLNEIRLTLQSTGVVSGQYGFVHAYEEKLNEIESWKNDTDEKIRAFVSSYIEILDKSIAHEKAQADESVELMKHKYGDRS